MISVVVPVFNERATIPVVLKRIKAVAMDKEIIIVDDGSTDGTGEYLQSLNDPVIKVLLHPKNLGKGAALRTGFQYAKGEIVIIQDADLEYHPEEYPQLIKPILDNRADVVYGSRFIGAHRVFLYSHYIGNKALNFITNILYNTILTDMMTGYKVFRKEVIKNLTLKASGFGIEAEMTAEIFKHGYIVYEVPISYSGRSYAEGKKINWYHFFVELYWLLRQKLLTYNAPLDTLLKMGFLVNYNDLIYQQIKPFIGKKVLEIGAGIGNITRYLLKAEQLVVTEISDENIFYLNRRFGEYPDFKILKQYITDANIDELRSYNFDTVVIINVLEHIKDDKGVLATIRKVIQKDGRLLILVPALPYLLGDLDISVGHYRRYSKKDLVDLLHSAGFFIEEIHYFNFLGILGWFLSSKILKKKNFSYISLRLFDKLCWLLKLEKIFKFSFGLSLIAVCKKAEDITV